VSPSPATLVSPPAAHGDVQIGANEHNLTGHIGRRHDGNAGNHVSAPIVTSISTPEDPVTGMIGCRLAKDSWMQIHALFAGGVC
jgi:hypothetical protein